MNEEITSRVISFPNGKEGIEDGKDNLPDYLLLKIKS